MGHDYDNTIQTINLTNMLPGRKERISLVHRPEI